MNKRRIYTAGVLMAALCFALPAHAQNRTRFAGRWNAIDYFYGGTVKPPGQVAGPLQVYTGNTATGSASITLAVAWTTLSDGTKIFPLNTNAPITIGNSTNQETVTPSALSACNYDAGYGSCTLTATFTYTHGTGENITSGTYGLQEAINAANGGQPAGLTGGVVDIEAAWAGVGGTNTTIGLTTPVSSVYIEDNRNAPQRYWSAQPSTLTDLAIPATQTTSTVTWTGSGTGTWSGTYYVCVTYVDMLGGEGPCSATSAGLASGTNYVMNVAGPVASTGAVGYRVYAGTTYAAAYLLPITSTTCTLTTAESVFNACAIGSAYVQPTLFVSTTSLRPQPTTALTVNVNQILPQGHTTFAYQPSATVPVPFQTNFGPFPSYGGLTSGQYVILGSAQLPAGYLNTIGRTIRVSGKAYLTTVNTAALPEITVSLSWAGGLTAGLPIAVCTYVTTAFGSTASAVAAFSCTLTTNAVGATAVGTVMTDGLMFYNAAAGGGTGVATIDTGTAAIGSLGLFAQDTLNILYTSATNATADEQLLDLHIETLQ